MTSAASRIAIDAPVPAEFPAEGFNHDLFEDLLGKYVNSDGHVDYDAWHARSADRDRLEQYLAAVAAYSPEHTPERFGSNHDELAYWLYAYNAYVIKGVLENWPLDSVTDVKAPFEIAKGFGFFYRQRFSFGQRWYSLYTVENKKIRAKYRDARIHFVLNCGSESCPVLRPELPTGGDLEPFLEESAARFVSEDRNVHVDHEKQEIRLSDIFRMYRKDYINHLRIRGLPSSGGLLDFIISVAPEPLRSELGAIRHYKIRFSDFDWSVNNANRSSGHP